MMDKIDASMAAFKTWLASPITLPSNATAADYAWAAWQAARAKPDHSEDVRTMVQSAERMAISDEQILEIAAANFMPVRFPHELIAFARAILAAQADATPGKTGNHVMAVRDDAPTFNQAEFDSLVEKGTKAWAGHSAKRDDAVGDAKDAERYRWLRKNATSCADFTDDIALVTAAQGPDYEGETDYLVDAAIAASKKDVP